MAPSRTHTALNRTTIANSILCLLASAGCGAALPEVSVESGVHAPAQPIELAIPQVPLPDPESDDAVSLAALLAYADQHAPAIAVARGEIAVSEAAVLGAEVVLQENPEVEVGLGARAVGGETGLDVEVGLRQSFEIGGQRGLRLETARAQVEVTRAEAAEVRWAVQVMVRRLFWATLLSAEARRQTETFVTYAEELAKRAGLQIEAGDASPLIMLVARSDLAQSREALVMAQAREARLKTRLAAVVGWPEGRSPTLKGALALVKPAPEAEALLSRMSAHHPSLRTRELAVVAAQHALALSDREGWPAPTIGLSYGRESDPGGEGADIVGLSLGLPLPMWNNNQSKRASARASLLLTDKQRQMNARRLRSDLDLATTALDAAEARVSLYAEGIMPGLGENLRLLRRAYELGEVDIHQVSQMRSRLLEGARSHLEAKQDFYEALADLEGLVGTPLWDEGEGEP